jgi:hypothetical protein
MDIRNLGTIQVTAQRVTVQTSTTSRAGYTQLPKTPGRIPERLMKGKSRKAAVTSVPYMILEDSVNSLSGSEKAN